MLKHWSPPGYIAETRKNRIYFQAGLKITSIRDLNGF